MEDEPLEREVDPNVVPKPSGPNKADTMGKENRLLKEKTES